MLGEWHMTTGVTKLTRRHALVGLGGVSVAAAAIWASLRDGHETRTGSEAAASLEKEAAREGANPDLFAIVSDIVLPETADGPAASVLGVHKFLTLALKHGLEGTLDAKAPYAPPENNYEKWLQAALDNETGGSFSASSIDRQREAVASIDAPAFADRAAPTPWTKIKALILIGYYTSEVGGSEVLRFNTIPGEYRGNVEKEPGMKALSNDWSAVKYG